MNSIDSCFFSFDVGCTEFDTITAVATGYIGIINKIINGSTIIVAINVIGTIINYGTTIGTIINYGTTIGTINSWYH